MKLYTAPRAPNPRRVAMFMAEKGIELDLQVARIHARQEKEIVDHAGDPISLMEQLRKLIVDVLREIFPPEQSFDPGAQHCYRRLQLMRSIGRKARGTLQFFACRFELRLGQLAFRAMPFRSHRQLFDRVRETPR